MVSEAGPSEKGSPANGFMPNRFSDGLSSVSHVILAKPQKLCRLEQLTAWASQVDASCQRERGGISKINRFRTVPHRYESPGFATSGN